MGTVQSRPKLARRHIKDLQRHVSFTEDEIQDWYNEFCHSIKGRRDDLYLSEEEFVKVYNQVYPGQCDDYARHIFRTFDLDENGKVDFREFLIGLSISGSSDPTKKLAWAFRVYDVNKNGYITLDEMTMIVRSVFKMIGPQTLHDGEVTKTPEAMADELFEQLDTNGDQRISWKEFRDGAPQIPSVLALLQCGPPDGDDCEDVFT